jgi:hypothetical protein
MSGSDLASGTANLLNLANASQPRSLNQLATMAIRHVRACCGATAAVWRGQEPLLLVASHPDLPELLEAQLRVGRGPVLDALAGGGPVSMPDALTERRWPEFARAALRRGVRCAFILAYQRGAPVSQVGDPDERETVTLSLFSARPRLLESSPRELAELLITFGGAVVGNAADYGDAQRTALQLRDAAESRTVVDQARGMLMQALGCTSDEAMQWLRRVSQQRNIRVADVAGRVLRGNGADTLGPPRAH